MNVLSDRLREAMELRGVDQTSLAKGVGVTQGAISLILNGKTRKSKHLPEIASYLRVPLTWLMGISGRMNDAPTEEMAITAEEQILIGDFRTLPIEIQGFVLHLLKSLAVTNLIDTGAIEVSVKRLLENRDYIDQQLTARFPNTVHDPSNGYRGEESDPGLEGGKD